MANILKRREFHLFVSIIVLIILVTLRAPAFILPSNLMDIMEDSSILLMVAIGQFMVILTAGIDLSVASICPTT